MQSTPDVAWVVSVEQPTVFNGISYADATGALRWAPCIPIVEMAAGVSYRIEVRDGRSYATRAEPG